MKKSDFEIFSQNFFDKKLKENSQKPFFVFIMKSTKLSYKNLTNVCKIAKFYSKKSGKCE